MSQTTANAASTQRFRQEQLRAVEKAIRRIVRANDLQSKALVKAVGLTSAQLVILKAVAALGEVTVTALSAHADLSAATVITILDNLEERGMIERYRSMSDRRIVHTRLTDIGKALIAQAPEPLGAIFTQRFFGLPEERRREIVAAVMELGDMLARDGKAVTNQIERLSPLDGPAPS